MKPGRGATRNKKCCATNNRRGSSAQLTLPGTLEDPTPPSWKGVGGQDQGFPPNSGPNFTGQPQGFQGQSPFPGPPIGSGSPAGVPFAGTPTGSSTPQYTASPAPSGSSTPGPPQPFPPTSNSAGPPVFSNGPNGPSPYGSPSNNGPPFGRPNSSGPPFGGPTGGPTPGNSHFNSTSGGPMFNSHINMAPGSPYNHGPPMHGPMASHGGMMPSGPNPMDRFEPPQGCFPVHRRNPTCFGQTDVRIHELNKRLQQRPEDSDNIWWDALTSDFFDDDASLTLNFTLEDGAKRYTIGRTLIPRYFRSIFEGGANELYFKLRNCKESVHSSNSINLDCDCTMVTVHPGKHVFTKICSEGKLVLQFSLDDTMKIKSWQFHIISFKEFVPRSALNFNPQEPIYMDLNKNISRQGVLNSTLNYLRLCVILEPMKELMSRQKAYMPTVVNPRDCLKTTLYQKWQRVCPQPESQRPPNKRRKRKGSQSSAASSNAQPGGTTKRSPGPNFSLVSQDVMVVGEPSLMGGGDFGEEDERLITRLENTQYDAAASSLEHHDGPRYTDSPMGGVPGAGPNNGPNPWVNSQNMPPAPCPDNGTKSPAVSQ